MVLLKFKINFLLVYCTILDHISCYCDFIPKYYCYRILLYCLIYVKIALFGEIRRFSLARLGYSSRDTPHRW